MTLLRVSSQQNMKEKLKEIRKRLRNDYFFSCIDPHLDMVLDYHKTDTLYFLFPLIERLMLEILLLDYNTDIEVSNQGTYRPLSQILKDENAQQVLQQIIGEKNTHKLESWFCDNEGMRNIVMKKLVTIKDVESIHDVKKVCIELLQAYADNIEDLKKFDSEHEIEPVQ